MWSEQRAAQVLLTAVLLIKVVYCAHFSTPKSLLPFERNAGEVLCGDTMGHQHWHWPCYATSAYVNHAAAGSILTYVHSLSSSLVSYEVAVVGRLVARGHLLTRACCRSARACGRQQTEYYCKASK
jgi:hypothetical protein